MGSGLYEHTIRLTARVELWLDSAHGESVPEKVSGLDIRHFNRLSLAAGQAIRRFSVRLARESLRKQAVEEVLKCMFV